MNDFDFYCPRNHESILKIKVKQHLFYLKISYCATVYWCHFKAETFSYVEVNSKSQHIKLFSFYEEKNRGLHK